MAGSDREARLAALRRRIAEDRRELDALLDAEQTESAAERLRGAFAGRDAAFQEVVGRLERLAGTSLPAVIEGPRGSGKSLLAAAIHQAGPRRDQPFRLLEPTESIEERWAAAGRGTLLVRHVERLPEPTQRALLERLKDEGGPRVLATALDLEGEGLLAPLRDRLRVLRLRLPALTETPEAIPGLFQRALREAGGGELSEAGAARVAERPWPGNLRELERAAQRVVETVGDEAVTPELLEPFLTDDDEGLATLEELERDAIAARLERFDWAQQRTAESLGIDRKTLYRKIRRYGLER